jgi:hypothetical protein
MLNFCIKLSASVTQNRSAFSPLAEVVKPDLALEAIRCQWLPYLKEAAGPDRSLLDYSLSAVTVRQSALGTYHVVFFAIPINYEFQLCMQIMVSCLDSAMYARAAALVITTLKSELESLKMSAQTSDRPSLLVGEIGDLRHELSSAWEAHDIIEASGKRAASSTR